MLSTPHPTTKHAVLSITANHKEPEKTQKNTPDPENEFLFLVPFAFFVVQIESICCKKCKLQVTA